MRTRASLPWKERRISLALPPPGWMKLAACKGLATRELDPWHPGAPRFGQDERRGLKRPAPKSPVVLYAAARLICAECPVRLECCQDGLALLGTGGVHGMMGGLTPVELRELARDLRLAATQNAAQHGTRSRYVGGCRCEECKRAQADYGRERKQAMARARPRCQGFSSYFHRPCLRYARPGSAFCYRHQEDEDVAS